MSDKIKPSDPLFKPLQAMIQAIDLICYNNSLVGQTLTIIDATGLDRDQKKAIKDLIKQAAWRNYDIVWRWMNDVRNAEGKKEGGSYLNFPFQDSTSLDQNHPPTK